MNPRFAGSVLAGGASTRMGADKAFIEIDGQPLILRSVRALADAGASPISVIGGDATRLAALGLSVIHDMSPGHGPAQAILTALELVAAPDPDLVVVLSCDLLDPSAASVTATVQALDASPEVAAAVPVVDHRRQWLHACWRRAVAIPHFVDAHRRGVRSIRGSVVGASVIDVEGIGASTVADADRPSDLPPNRSADP